MGEGEFTDDDVRAILSENGDPATFFVFSDCIMRLDDKGQAWALLIEEDNLAEAAKAYLIRHGQVRSTLPDFGGDFRLD